MIRSTKARKGRGVERRPRGGAEIAKPRHRGSGDRVPCGEQARWVGPRAHAVAWPPVGPGERVPWGSRHGGSSCSGPMQLPGTKGRLSDPIRSPGSGFGMLGFRLLAWLGVSAVLGPHPVAWLGGSGCSGARGCPRPAGRVRRRWDVAGRWDVADAVGWRSAGRRDLGAAASRPHGPPGGGLGRAGPGWPGRWGRHGASGAGGGLRTRLRGRVQSGKTQPPSRTARAVRWAGWMTRVVRPTSSGWVGAPPRVGGNRVVAARSRAASPSVPLGSWVLGGGLSVRVVGFGWCLAAGVVAGVVLARVLAGDQHPGHRPVTGQSPAGLGVQRSGPADLTPDRLGVAEQAVQVHDHAQLRPDPTGLGQPTALQVAAGQLGQGISVALAAAAGVVGVGWAGQRLQGGQQTLAGLGFQQPIHRDHARQRSGPATTRGGHDGAPGHDRRRRGRPPGAGGP